MRVALSGNAVSCNWANVLWVQCVAGSPPSQANLDAVVDAIALAYHNRFQPQLTTSSSLTLGTGLYFTGPSTVLRSSRTFSYGGTHSTGTDEAGQVAACISWATNQYFRGGHPRTYLAGLRSDQLTNGKTFTGALVTALTSAAGSFLSDVNAITAGTITQTTLGLMRFVNGGSVLNPGEFHTFIGASVNARVDTQRRRLGK